MKSKSLSFYFSHIFSDDDIFWSTAESFPKSLECGYPKYLSGSASKSKENFPDLSNRIASKKERADITKSVSDISSKKFHDRSDSISSCSDESYSYRTSSKYRDKEGEYRDDHLRRKIVEKTRTSEEEDLAFDFHKIVGGIELIRV